MRPTFVTSKHIREKYDVSGPTLIRWADTGKVRFVRATDVGRRLYHEGDVAKFMGIDPADQEEPKVPEIPRATVLYARVSSPHQKEDLNRQSETLKDASRDTSSPAHSATDPELVTDVASGLNWKRRGLRSILDRASSGGIEKVVVAHKDRLARIGVELIEWYFKKFNVQLVVLDKSPDSDEPSELRDDLLAITTFFVAKNNGLRSAENRRRRTAKGKEQVLSENQEDGSNETQVRSNPRNKDQVRTSKQSTKKSSGRVVLDV